MWTDDTTQDSEETATLSLHCKSSSHISRAVTAGTDTQTDTVSFYRIPRAATPRGIIKPDKKLIIYKIFPNMSGEN